MPSKSGDIGEKGQFYYFASGFYTSMNVGRVEVFSPHCVCCFASNFQKADDICRVPFLIWAGISECVPLNTGDPSGRKDLGINKHLWQR